MRRWKPLGFSPALERAWPDGVAIYNPLSGETHILDPLAHEVLDLLGRQELSGSEIADELARMAGEDLPELPDVVDRLLTELDRLGLIEAVP